LPGGVEGWGGGGREAEWGLTPAEEAELLEEFKGTLAAAGCRYRADLHSDWTLLRFLRARDYHTKRAASMFMNHLAWRETYGVDDILEKDFPEREAILRLFPQGYHGCCKEGRPIYVQHLGSVDLQELTRVASEERVVQLFIQEYEKFLRVKLPAASLAAGHFVDQSFTILDVRGVGLGQVAGPNSRLIKKILSISQDNYPELMGRMFVINAPAVFKVIFSLFKPLIGARTQKKVEVHGRHYRDKLLAFADSAQLPRDVGGSSPYTIADDFGPWNLLVGPRQGAGGGAPPGGTGPVSPGAIVRSLKAIEPPPAGGQLQTGRQMELLNFMSSLAHPLAPGELSLARGAREMQKVFPSMETDLMGVNLHTPLPGASAAPPLPGAPPGGAPAALPSPPGSPRGAGAAALGWTKSPGASYLGGLGPVN